jgi:two-component system cell cycle sensor histidine kinase/response regulator CckA
MASPSVDDAMTTALPSLRILLVENDDRYARVLQQEINTSGRATLGRVSTLADAAASVSAGGIDAVLLDLGPSGLDLGPSASFDLDALDRLRLLTTDRIPIVVLTAEGNDTLADQALEHGAQDYIVKSRTDAELVMRSVRYARERAEWQREARRHEGELLQVQKMEAIGRLAGGVAHDFNNVLTAIFGYSDLLLEQFTDDDPRRADVQEIRRSAERAAALTHQLLAFSRKQLMQPRVLDLNEVIANLEKLLTRLIGEDVTLNIRAQDDLWHVRADPSQMEQVLMNLAANARDAMPEGGGITVETANVELEGLVDSSRPGLQPGAYVTMTVTDTGTGVPESIRSLMFEPFFTTKEQGKGTGLGLATVYGIVKQTGGSVYVDSEEGAGTRFVVYLPRVP